VIWNRSLIKTKGGALGLVSTNVRVGDWVCIIYGCTVPVILRRKKKDQGALEDEDLEDRVELLKAYVRKCEHILIRKAKYRKQCRDGVYKDKDIEEFKEMKEEMNKKLKEWKRSQDARTGGEKHRKGKEKEANATNETRPSTSSDNSGQHDNPTEPGDSAADVDSPHPEDSLSDEDNAGDGGNQRRGEHEGAKHENSGIPNEGEAPKTKTDPNDRNYFYEFLGESYIHGMMDGEALREKFYKDIQDNVFELR
jgi:hypothetical protein